STRGSIWHLTLATSKLHLPRLRDLAFKSLKRSPNQGSKPSLRQPFGQRVYRRDPAEVNEVLLAAFERFSFGMVDNPRLERVRFAKGEHLISHRKIILHERQVPPAAMQPGRAIVEDDLENGFGMLFEPFRPASND